MSEVRLRDGRVALLRPSVPEDAEDFWRLVQLLAEDGRGMVLLPEEVPADPETERAKLQGYSERPGDYALTAEIDGVAMGSLDITRIPRTQLRHNAYLTMGIHPDVQGVGLGRHMMAAAVGWAREAGVVHLELNVLADNARAIALYRAFGFETVYLRERFLRRPDGRWCADWLMLCRPQEVEDRVPDL